MLSVQSTILLTLRESALYFLLLARAYVAKVAFGTPAVLRPSLGF